MDEEDLQKTLDEARRVFGLTDDDPEYLAKCPGCGGEVPVWDLDELPMGYECFSCAANYKIMGQDDIELVQEW
ncbi:hypothetical protein C483_02261 [Natrialba hulunbeirensis JCM 10989]|uniref:Uncharacterized protein n=1 Tax=Natrialba hulunbeirensis JCM 10989 TaxID=1227493 RepID=M0A8R0_9EURY|nr:hypothetical protein [Natrialba hulunbeirensis]ELY95150.1 hypothetical protein C483_02261 [Natrialba hulunbeirensis JCM 10989]